MNKIHKQTDNDKSNKDVSRPKVFIDKSTLKQKILCLFLAVKCFHLHVQSIVRFCLPDDHKP